MTALLHTTYFGPISWYRQLYRADHAVLDDSEPYTKQTTRNRCVIATANGLQTLTVPVELSSFYGLRGARCENTSGADTNLAPRTSHLAPRKTDFVSRNSIRDVRISQHGSWRRVHWNALQSAYSESPFFEFYEDDIRPFFEQDYEFLYDLNFCIIRKMCELLDIRRSEELRVKSEEFATAEVGSPVGNSSLFTLHSSLNKEYYQVFAHKHGFQPDLSILDLLFNMGPESIFYL